MAKKSMTERVLEVMKYPERIRNVATSSHVHHGKCVTPETLVFTLRKVAKAKELFKLAQKYGRIVKNTENETVYDISELNLYTNSIKGSKIVARKILYAWKLKNDDKIFQIELADGRSIEVTPMHKFICLKDNELIEKEAAELKEGDLVLVPSKIFVKEMDLAELKRIILKELSKDYGFLVYVNKNTRDQLLKSLVKVGRKKIWNLLNSKLSFDSFYNGAWKGRYRLSDYVQLLEFFHIDLKEGYDSIDSLSYRRGIKRFGSRTSVKIKLPKTFEEFVEFFYFVGLMFGDGSINFTFDNESNYLISRVFKICKDIFDIECSLRKYKNKCRRVYINGGLTIKMLFNRLFYYPLKAKSRNLDLPEYFFNLPLPLISAFVKGYFDTDGYVHQQISLTSASKTIIKKIQLLLLRFGLLSYIREKNGYYYLKISGKPDLKEFVEDIGFEISYKNGKAGVLAKNARESKVYSQAIKIGLNLFALPIRRISILENVREVFDFTVEDTHNFLANGLFVHNTTLTDNLMAGAGMIAEEMAGKVMYTWFDPEERKRELTVYGANVSMVHEYENNDYLINLVDTPGHVDFGGDVTRAMRAVDGTIVLICAVEGIMPQTETVFRQALREYVKPVLFINKTDRLIKELKLSPQQMLERFEKLIKEVNSLIKKYAPKEFKDKWMVSVQDGSVAFGSAYKRWAISIPYMKKTGITFKQIIDLTLQGKEDELAKIAPLHQVVLDMIIKHLPSPIEAQKYRVPKIWKGDIDSEVGKQMLSCDSKGKLAAIVTKMVPDPHIGFVATARIFSGKVYKGKEVYLINQGVKKKIQQVAIYKGINRIPVDEVEAGNIAAIVGIPEAGTGETLCEPDTIIPPFAEIKHLFEPVVTKSVEPKNPMELPKLIEALKKIAREDPTLKVKINQETGEYLVSGLGELHLEIKVEHKLRDMGLDVVMSQPIVVYRETVSKKSPQVEGKSPNKHNKLYFIIEPLEDGVYEAMKEDRIPSDIEVKKKNLELFKALEEAGMPKEDARNVKLIYEKNVFIDLTKGVQYLNEIMEMVKDAFREVMEDGPLAREPCIRVKVKLVDAELHEDPVHRGPGQIMPAVRWAIRQGMLKGGATLLEPKQIIRIDTPGDYMGVVIREVENRRGQIMSMKEENGATVITAKVPVAEMFGFDARLKSITSGRGFYSLMDIVFEKIPTELREKTIKSIRKRKGLNEEIPKAEI